MTSTATTVETMPVVSQGKRNRSPTPNRHARVVFTEPKSDELQDPHPSHSSSSATADRFDTKSEHTRFAMSWGYAARGRNGSGDSKDARVPMEVRHTKGIGVACIATAVHHSIITSDVGNIYSFGEGLSNQLGHASRVQYLPRQVYPTGSLKVGRDVFITQVDGGISFSVAREAHVGEGLASIVEHFPVKRMAMSLLQTSAGSEVLRRVLSYLRQEKYFVARENSGAVFTWGTGARGELGQGTDFLNEPSPSVVRSLRSKQLVEVTAGFEHVLAISTLGEAFSWGSGKSGKLGHGDFEDRFEPTQIMFFARVRVVKAAASTSHSVLLALPAGAMALEDPLELSGSVGHGAAQVFAFGRGAHGRLGTGITKNSPSPAPVIQLPPSFHGLCIKAIACGSAHTLLLGAQTVAKTLANPHGVRTAVYGWGYGGNGQLGTGHARDEHAPTKAKMPKWEIVTSIAAGKSFSVARTNNGELYAWGRGWHGPLGLKDRSVSLVPRKLDSYAVFLDVQAKYQHVAATCVHRAGLSQDEIHAHAAFTDFFWRLPRRVHSKLLCKLVCIRQQTHKPRSCRRISCGTCKMNDICAPCAWMCHRKHELVSGSVEPLRSRHSPVPLPPTVKSLKAVNIQEWRLGMCSGSRSWQWMAKIPAASPHAERKPHSALASTEAALRKSQCLKSDKQGAGLLNASPVLCPCGFSALCRLLPTITEGHDEDRERLFDPELQSAALCIQTMARGCASRWRLREMKAARLAYLRTICEKVWKQEILGRVFGKVHRRKEKARERREGIEMRVEDELRKEHMQYAKLQQALMSMEAVLSVLLSFIKRASAHVPGSSPVEDADSTFQLFDWASARSLQLCKHPSDRVPPHVLAKACSDFPLYGRRPAYVSDSDVMEFVHRCIHPSWKHVAAHLTNPSVRALNAAKGRLRSTKSVRVAAPPRPRRHTVADPSQLYRRVRCVGKVIYAHVWPHRRRSMPDSLRHLYACFDPKCFSHTAAIRSSVSVDLKRQELMLEYVGDARYQRRIALLPPKRWRERLEKVLQSSWMTPRIDLQVRSTFAHPERRRSIGEPERIASARAVYFSRRRNFAELRALGTTLGQRHRRRSFDFGEWKDAQIRLLPRDSLSRTAYPSTEEPATVEELRRMFSEMNELTAKVAVRANQQQSQPPMQQTVLSLQGQKGARGSTLAQHLVRTPADAHTCELVPLADDQGKAHFHDPRTGESHWAPGEQASDSAPTPQTRSSDIIADLNWVQYLDESSGLLYWYNLKTGHSVWSE